MMKIGEFIPRDYQVAAVEKALACLDSVSNKEPMLIQAPTGAGKSLMIGMLTQKISQINLRVLIITPRILLLQQTIKYIPDCGVCSGSLGDERDHHIVIGTYQSLIRRPLNNPVDVVIVDECHLLPYESPDSEYAALLRRLSGAVVYGFTATATRSNTHIYKGSRACWSCIYSINIKELIVQGYLVPPVSFKTHAGRSISEEDDLTDYDLMDEIMPSMVNKLKAIGRQKILIFTKDISHIEHVVKKISEINDNYRLDAIHSGMNQGTVRAIIHRFDGKEPMILVSCNMLMTGFDAPKADAVVILRRISQIAAYIQLIGRGLRSSPAKTECAVLDYGNNIKRFGTIDCCEEFHGKNKKSGNSKFHQKSCPECEAENPLRAKECCFCGYGFRFQHTLTNTSAADQVISLNMRRSAIVSTAVEETNKNFQITYNMENGDKVLRLVKTYRPEEKPYAIYELVGSVGRFISFSA